MRQSILSATRALVVLTLLTGVIYPLVVTAAAQIIFPNQANGSLIEIDGQIVGSELIGQQTEDMRYFQWRPSAVDYMLGADANRPTSSGATNYGATSSTLADLIAQRRDAFADANGVNAVAVPDDMLTASGSGLDPHISPAAARLQIDRVANARGLDRGQVAQLVEQYTEAPQLGILGEPRVNVLLLNIALEALD